MCSGTIETQRFPGSAPIVCELLESGFINVPRLKRRFPKIVLLAGPLLDGLVFACGSVLLLSARARYCGRLLAFTGSAAFVEGGRKLLSVLMLPAEVAYGFAYLPIGMDEQRVDLLSLKGCFGKPRRSLCSPAYQTEEAISQKLSPIQLSLRHTAIGRNPVPVVSKDACGGARHFSR